MLRATIEIVPFGEESRKRTLSIVEIANITPYRVYCDYACRLIFGKEVKSIAYVRKFDRGEGAEKLTQLALRELLKWKSKNERGLKRAE